MKNNSKYNILAIETSCDETAAAVVGSSSRKQETSIKIISNVVASQIEIHKLTGGVVPEVAARAHIEKIIPVITQSLGEVYKNFKNIDAITVTSGPGLLGSLLVGVETAKTLAWAKKLPIIPINHIEAHIYANFVGANPKSQIPISKQVRNEYLDDNFVGEVKPKNGVILANEVRPESRFSTRLAIGEPRRTSENDMLALPNFPALCLVVSGGHTSLILMRGHGQYKTIGETLDDAAGEAFDKAAAILGLPYPGGPSIARAASAVIPASKARPESPLRQGSEGQADSGQARMTRKISLPRPLINEPNFDFSFSGLKTALLYKVKELSPTLPPPHVGGGEGGGLRSALAAEFQQAVVDVLVSKTLQAAEKYEVKSILLAGGVAANSALRAELGFKVKSEKLKVKLFLPEAKLCTDNAAIVGICAAYKILKKRSGIFIDPEKINADANLHL